jgi:hypothetical protein
MRGGEMSTLRCQKFAGALLSSWFAVGSVLAPAAAQDNRPTEGSAPEIRAVLELFTSQGCSSCPPADALLGSFAKRPDIIAMSLPVDYWDYLGWKDTLANPKFAKRQKHYAKERGDGRVYTPQMVVNGSTHVVGSSLDAIEAAIASTEAELAPSRVAVRVRLDGPRIVIETGDAPAASKIREATIWLAMMRKQVSVKIERGENRGKTVTYLNVVRDLNPIGMWSGKAARLEVSREAVAESENESCVVMIQAGKGGPIIGAARIDNL